MSDRLVLKFVVNVIVDARLMLDQLDNWGRFALVIKDGRNDKSVETVARILLRESFVYSFVFLFFGLSCTCLMAYFRVEEAMCDNWRSRGNRTIQSFV